MPNQSPDIRTSWTYENDTWRYLIGGESAFISSCLEKRNYKELLKGTPLTPEEVKLFAIKYISNRKGYYVRKTGGIVYIPPYMKGGKSFPNLSLKVVVLHLVGVWNLAIMAHPKTTKYLCLDLDTKDTGIMHAVREAIGYPLLISRSYKGGKGYHLEIVLDISGGLVYTDRLHRWVKGKLKEAGLDQLLIGENKKIEILPERHRPVTLPLSHNLIDLKLNGYYLDNDLQPIGGLKESLTHLASYPSPTFSDLISSNMPQVVEGKRTIVVLIYRCVDTFLKEGLPAGTRHFALRGTINALMSMNYSHYQIEELLKSNPYQGRTPRTQHIAEVKSLLKNQYNRESPYKFNCAEFRNLVTDEYCSACPIMQRQIEVSRKTFNPLSMEFWNRLSPTEQAVYRAHIQLHELYNKREEPYYASLEVIARIAGVTTRTILTTNESLEELGLLEKLTQGYKVITPDGFKGANNTYKLVSLTQEKLRAFLEITQKWAKI